MDKQLIEVLTNEGYFFLREVDGQVCGLHQYVFTCGLVVGLNESSYERRYCYENRFDAVLAFAAWNGKEHPSGPWIKLKGRYQGKGVDMLNPELES